jgi:hypothetical protein
MLYKSVRIEAKQERRILIKKTGENGARGEKGNAGRKEKSSQGRSRPPESTKKLKPNNISKKNQKRAKFSKAKPLKANLYSDPSTTSSFHY